MSETLVNTDKDQINDDDNDAAAAAAAKQKQTAIANNAVADDDDEDLEDGEIDDDDDDDAVAIVESKDSDNAKQVANANDECVIVSNSSHDDKLTEKTSQAITSVDLVGERSPSEQPTKSKKSHPVEDDHASSIEHAIASALKKKGIEPPMPKILESRNGLENESAGAQASSRSSRRRKRKRQRDEKEKQKEQKEKKKQRYASPDAAIGGSAPPLDDDDEDDYEMLNVRGGSPPPIAHAPSTTAMQHYKEQYESADDSCSTYNSYESYGDAGDGANAADAGGGNRRRRRNKKDSRKRRGERNNGKQEKRSRRDSMDEKQHRPQEPRKLELCKFYLMECCAKKDKCSYMHSDFPCKYYYLGMECVQKDTCKFAHGAPLSEHLRNILLKHLETAPKEILGNFKRISRENAVVMITKRHEELCKQFKVENTWAGVKHFQMSDQMQQKHQQQFMQQQHQQQQQQQQQMANIPSLLDIVVNPPPIDVNGNGQSIGGAQMKGDKQRKSRWAETVVTNSSNQSRTTIVEPPSSSAPSYLDLKNLTGILSVEHIEKLSQLGIVNLEQVKKLTFEQLNQIGLTIAEITEIQLNAINMDKLRVDKSAAVVVGGDATVLETTKPNKPATTKDANANEKSAEHSISAVVLEKDAAISSNSNSSSGVIMVDYSQYLKDSNLSFDRNDMYDDEKDEEQLVIDDGNLENEETTVAAASHATISADSHNHAANDERKTDPFASEISTQRVQPLPDLSNALKNPFNTLYGSNSEQKKEQQHARDPRQATTTDSTNRRNIRNPFKTYDDEDAGANASDQDERYYGSNRRSRSRSRSRTPTRSQSSTPEASQSPEPQDDASVGTQATVYERATMYDFSTRQVEEEELRAAKSVKADKDMRFLQGSSLSGDIDLRLPFQPVTNYTPATEIDGSITSHLPMTYKVYEVEMPRPSYLELRQNFKSDQTFDPRLRRILGLPELSQTKTSAALSRTVRKLSNSIASPESEGASPKYYTPPSSNSHHQEERKPSKSSTTSSTSLRLDPRRAASAATAATSTSSSSSTATASGSTSSANSATSSGAMKQNIEIRNLLQKSEWYKNLNSKFKIMVNQQLALVSTELKKFHQDPSPQKIFDISFIVNNQTLQQILTNLGIYIDDNGEVAHVDADNDAENGTAGGSGNNSGNGITLPNLSQPPPTQQQLDFLRAPPPNMAPPHLSGAAALAQQIFRATGLVAGQAANLNILPFGGTLPPNARPSLLGMPPGNPFNPFAANLPDIGLNPNLVGGPGAAGIMGFAGNFAGGMQRNFGNQQQRNHHQRNQNRRNNFGGGGAQ